MNSLWQKNIQQSTNKTFMNWTKKMIIDFQFETEIIRKTAQNKIHKKVKEKQYFFQLHF